MRLLYFRNGESYVGIDVKNQICVVRIAPIFFYTYACTYSYALLVVMSLRKDQPVGNLRLYRICDVIIL